MDIQKKLQSILAPLAGPVNRSQPAGPRPATPSSGQSFAHALQDAVTQEDPDIAPFGVLERPRRPPGSPEADSADAGGPTVLPDIPTEPILDLPIDPPLIEIRDTLESMGLIVPEPPSSAEIPSLPPLGVLWAPVTLKGSGATGAGIAGTDAATRTDLQNKFEYYSNPEKYGLVLNQEARLFLDAVDKGYVSNTPEGLGTLLAGLGRGALGENARPPEMTEYFRQFYHG